MTEPANPSATLTGLFARSMPSTKGRSAPSTSLVEEEQGAQRLVLRRGQDPPHCRQVREVLPDLVRAHLAGVSLRVEEDESLNRLGLSLLGADAIMPEPQAPDAPRRGAKASQS